jgi:hypothetical protein
VGAKILVALRNRDRLSDVIPHIEEVAKPGMKVVFLIRFAPSNTFGTQPVNGFASRLDNQTSPAEDMGESTSVQGNLMGMRSLARRLAAEHKVYLAMEGLRKRGVEITVDVYTGSLKRVLKGYTVRDEIHMIIKIEGRALAVAQFLRNALSVLSFFKQPDFAPVRLLRA